MRYKLLGRSGLRVTELSLGTMTFGEEWGWGASRDESYNIFKAYCDAGGNFIDTANRYTEGTSEKLVGEFVRGDREHFVVATKYTLFMRTGDPNFLGNHRKNMVQSVEASLKRLGMEYIDLLWLHAWDFMTPIEEVMRALDDLVRAGKVLYVGVSDTPAWVVSRANLLAELRGWTPFVALQVPYSLVRRDVERELLPMARALDLAITPWGTVAGGVLTGKYRKDGDTVKSDDSKRHGISITAVPDRNLTIAEEVRKVAEARGVTPAQVALNWVRSQPGTMIPILGARTLAQITDNLGCLNFTLTEEELNRLDETSKIELGFPHDFLTVGNIAENVIHGKTLDQVDNHRRHELPAAWLRRKG